MAILLAESGSTKTDWVVLDGPQQGLSFQTAGMNPSYHGPEQMVMMLMDEFPSGVEDIREVIYYGAGCSAPAPRERMRQVLEHFFVQVTARVEHDLLAAARGLLGNQAGLVCILGTGSHACQYDGHTITDEAVNLGYVLGDEGSGCHMGKTLLRDFLYGSMSAETSAAFKKAYHPERDAVIDRLYRQPAANRYLAGFAQFLAICPDRAYADSVLQSCFGAFIQTHLMPLYQANPGPVAFTGGIAHQFKSELEQAMEAAGLPKPAVAPSPLEGLVRFHRGA